MKVLTTQKKKISSQIEKEGWQIINIDDYEWWEHEVWEIESLWSPIGKKAFITFIVDPQILKDKNAVISVVASAKRTTGWSGDENSFELYFNNKWEKELINFIKFLSKLRNK